MYDSSIAKDYEYRPLLGLFEIRQSDIEGQGLFVKEDKVILSGDVIVNSRVCQTHVEVQDGSYTRYIRTPVGGFLNHSDEPNCKLERVRGTYNFFKLVALRPLKGGEEVTVCYGQSKICGG